MFQGRRYEYVEMVSHQMGLVLLLLYVPQLDQVQVQVVQVVADQK